MTRVPASQRVKQRTGAGRAGAPEEDRPSVYDRIRSDILSLALPPGQDLDETSLSRRYGVSRTPVREALIRLSSEHLIVLSQARARVSALILADYPRFIEALDLTRRAIARLAALRRHDSDLVKITTAETAFAEAARDASLADYNFAQRIAPLEHALHTALAEAGHNRYLTQSYAQLMTVGHRMLRLPYGYDPRGNSLAVFMKAVVGRHRALVRAIEAEKPDLAEAAAGELTRGLVERLRSYLEENLSAEVEVDAEATHTIEENMPSRTHRFARK